MSRKTKLTLNPIALQQKWQQKLHHITIGAPTFHGGVPVARGKCNDVNCKLCNPFNPMRTLEELIKFNARHASVRCVPWS